jgi:tetrahydromethanopterin S-methyltransferase subunit A
LHRTRKDKIEDVIGEVCRLVIPVRDQFSLGSGTNYAICTLGSMDLLNRLAGSEILEHVCIVGRLLSENKGIDKIVEFTLSHPLLEKILVCGSDVPGHLPGQALLALHKSGVDNTGRIIGAQGHRPLLQSSIQDVNRFRNQVQLLDKIGEEKLESITSLIT